MTTSAADQRSPATAGCTDAELVQRLRDADLTAVRDLLERDHRVVALFARVLVGDERPDVVATVLRRAWTRVVHDVLTGRLTAGLREAACGHVAAAHAPVAEEPRAAAPLGTFAPEHDRWAGWWESEPPSWPPGTTPGTPQVLQALDRLPAQQRAVLVLCHVGGVAPARLHEVIGVQGAARVLEQARDGFLAELDRGLASR